RLATTTSDPGIDQRVQHRSTGQSQPGHDRDGKRGEQLTHVAARRAPGDLPAVAHLRLVGDVHPRLAGVLAVLPDLRGPRGVSVLSARPLGHGHVRKGPDYEDLLPVLPDLWWPRE